MHFIISILWKNSLPVVQSVNDWFASSVFEKTVYIADYATINNTIRVVQYLSTIPYKYLFKYV